MTATMSINDFDPELCCVVPEASSTVSESKHAISSSFRHDRSHGETAYVQTGFRVAFNADIHPNGMLNGHTLN